MKRWLLAAGVLLALVVSPWVGDSLEGTTGDFILWQLRLPRVLTAAVVGSILGVTGAALQLLFSNPLATPSTIGTTAGAALGVLAVLVFGVPPGWSWALMAAAFLGAGAASVIVVAVSARGTSMQDVLLAGIAVALAAGALGTGLQWSADQSATFAAVRWSLGNLSQLGYERVTILGVVAAITTAGLLSQSRALTAVTRGEALASTQGVSVPQLRVVVLGVCALGVGAAVAFCGPIAFVGLMVPHLVRGAGAQHPRVLLIASAAVGAGFLAAADTLARVVWPGHELPVGVLTAALGAPSLIWVLARRRQG